MDDERDIPMPVIYIVMGATLATWVLMFMVLVTSILTADIFLFKIYVIYWGLTSGAFFIVWSKDFSDPDTRSIFSRKVNDEQPQTYPES